LSDELQQRLDAWCANVYAHRPHGGLKGRTPHDVAAELSADCPPRFAEEKAIGMLLMPPAGNGGVRVVGKKAIRVDGVEYWVDRLIPGQRLQVRLDPADAGKVWLYTDTDPWRFVGIGLNPELAGLDRAELAGRVRAEQAAVEREGRARLRRLVRKADIHSVADRMIGRVPPPLPANIIADWSTPELDEARRAHDQMPSIADLSDRRAEAQQEETLDERYARAKALRAALDAGAEISADSRAWLEGFEDTPDFRGLKLLEEIPRD
jgi:putative transposase